MGTGLNLPERTAWENRFERPTIAALSSHYQKQLGALFEGARERLLEFEGVTEGVSWQGLPWRWTVVYEVEGDPTPAWVYLVADPEGVVLCVPVNRDIIESMPMKRLKKHIRDGIYMGKQVQETVWSTWQVTARTQLDEVLDVAKRKHKFIVASRGAEGS
jgi:hypothetical protein